MTRPRYWPQPILEDTDDLPTFDWVACLRHHVAEARARFERTTMLDQLEADEIHEWTNRSLSGTFH